MCIIWLAAVQVDFQGFGDDHCKTMNYVRKARLMKNHAFRHNLWLLQLKHRGLTPPLKFVIWLQPQYEYYQRPLRSRLPCLGLLCRLVASRLEHSPSICILALRPVLWQERSSALLCSASHRTWLLAQILPRRAGAPVMASRMDTAKAKLAKV